MNTGAKPLLGSLWARPRLVSATLVGLGIYGGLPYVAAWTGATRFLVSWNAAVLLYLVLAGAMVVRSSHEAMRNRALAQEEGRVTVLLLVVFSEGKARANDAQLLPELCRQLLAA